MFEARAGAVL